MKPIIQIALLASIFSNLSLAQVISSGAIIERIKPLDQQLLPTIKERVSNKVDDPFALSSLPEIKNTITEPLNKLSSELEINALDGSLIYREVEVENGYRALERQWLVLADDETLAVLNKIGANIISRRPFSNLGLSFIHFIAPQHADSKATLSEILPEATRASLDRNHIFNAQTGTKQKGVNRPIKIGPACLDNIAIGMVDAGIDKNHEMFLQANITTNNMLPENVQTPMRHGTAVASLFVGKGPKFQALLPNGQLYAASVFHRQSDFAQGATTVNIIKGLDWLAAQKLRVINMSLAGPDNQLLALTLKKLREQNIVIVAAAGNEGPMALPLFPAAYEEVIAVSATDQNGNSYRWSNRGEHIDYSALGVNVPVAELGKKVGLESGTSMASPMVAALLACQLSTAEQSLESADAVLRGQAIDLGDPGKDPIFGYGLLHSL